MRASAAGHSQWEWEFRHARTVTQADNGNKQILEIEQGMNN